MTTDLHCHTTASDGQLTPNELIERAKQQGVSRLAITDHDSMDGYFEVCEQADVEVEREQFQLIAGVELSCIWGKALIHIVGLKVDPKVPVLVEGLQSQQLAREQRAVIIAQKLEKLGFSGALEYASALAGDGQVGRPHFARFLVEKGHVSSISQAFKKYLGAGKPGDVKLTWPALETVVSWIVASGGQAVLAHPLKYKMTATKLRALIADFKAAGGVAIEVVSGKQTADQTQHLAQLSQRYQLLASIGSDFHQPDQPWNELGQMGELPKSCEPVWSGW